VCTVLTPALNHYYRYNMGEKNAKRITINSISQLHSFIRCEPPAHPLIILIKYDDVLSLGVQGPASIISSFYVIMIKRHLTAKLKYGHRYYDFDEGVIAMMAPGQLLSIEGSEDIGATGWLLAFHPDFIRTYTLGKTIREYGFFSYDVNEALHLSQKEEKMIERIMRSIRQEYHSSIDQFSQDLMVSHLEVMLNYLNRFYNRQFLTRKTVSCDVLMKVEQLLNEYFDCDKVQIRGLPTVQYLSEQLHISPNYLSDMLRSYTGQGTQQHIHDKLIERAKDALTSTTLSVSEIGYKLGFEHAQSFSRLFKRRTNTTPLEFRALFSLYN
jgi:AraC family transcriptional activator of pobA